MALSNFINSQGGSGNIFGFGTGRGLSAFSSMAQQQEDEPDYERRIANIQQRLTAIGQPIPVEKEEKTILDRLFDTLNYLNLKKNQALSYISGNREAFSQDISGADLLQQWGMGEGVGNQIAGFAFDVLTDPLNFLTFGTAGAASQAAKAGARAIGAGRRIARAADDIPALPSGLADEATQAAKDGGRVFARFGAFGRYWNIPGSDVVIGALGNVARGAARGIGRFIEQRAPELARIGQEARDLAGRLFVRGYGVDPQVTDITKRYEDLYYMDVQDIVNEVTGMVKNWKNVDHMKVISAVENPAKLNELNPQEMEAFNQVRDFFDYHFAKAQEYGVIDEFRANYIPHIFKGKKEEVAEALEQLRRRGVRVPTQTGFAQERTILMDLADIMADPKLREKLKPETDLAKIMGIYKLSLQKAIRNREMLDELANLGPDVIRRVGVDEIPDDWVRVPIPQLRGYAVPADIARHLKDTMEPFVNSDSANKLFRIYDRILGWWKGMATIPNPGFHFRNAMGNIFNNYLAGVRSIEPYRLALHALRAEDVRLDQFYDLIRRSPLDDLVMPPGASPDVPIPAGLVPNEQVAVSRAFNEPKFREMLTGGEGPKIKIRWNNQDIEVNMTGIKLLAKIHGILDRGFMSGDITNTIEDVLRRLRSQSSIQDINPLSRENILFRSAERMGNAIDNHARLAHFIDRLQKGDTPAEAAMSVKKYLFDYTMLTPFEKNVMRRFIPFYAFTRYNLPLQIKELVKQPKYAALMGKFKDFAEAMAEEVTGQEIESRDLPKYLRELYALRLPFQVGGRDVVAGIDLPIRDINTLNPDEWFSMITPFLTVPFEQVANRNIYFDRDLEAYEGQTVRAPGYIQGIFKMIQAMDEDAPYSQMFNQIANRLGFTIAISPETGQPEVRVPVRTAHLLNQFVAAKNIGKAIDFLGGESYDPFSVSSMLTGVTAVSSTAEQRERRRQYEQYQRLQDLLRKLRDEGRPVPTLDELEDLQQGGAQFGGFGLSSFVRGR